MKANTLSLNHKDFSSPVVLVLVSCDFHMKNLQIQGFTHPLEPVVLAKQESRRGSCTVFGLVGKIHVVWVVLGSPLLYY